MVIATLRLGESTVSIVFASLTLQVSHVAVRDIWQALVSYLN